MRCLVKGIVNSRITKRARHFEPTTFTTTSIKTELFGLRLSISECDLYDKCLIMVQTVFEIDG
jgi:hypothetical protein